MPAAKQCVLHVSSGGRFSQHCHCTPYAHLGPRLSRFSKARTFDSAHRPFRQLCGYRKFYSSVDTSCVPYIGIYLTQLHHYADQYKELVLVPIPASHPAVSSPQGVPSSPTSLSSAHSAGSSPLTHISHHHPGIQTITHINFTRLFKCAEVIHQMLRHQMKGYRQANPSAAATHAVPDPSQALGISLGVENAQVMSYVETMLTTGGVGTSPPPDLPLVTTEGSATSTGPTPVGVAETWYWHRSSELQTTERETSDIRKGLEAAGF